MNFYTGQVPANYVFTWHKANVRSISWLEDEVGFVSSDADCTIAVWMLPRQVQNAELPAPLWTYKTKSLVNINSVIAFRIPGEIEKDHKTTNDKIQVYASLQDGTVLELIDRRVQCKFQASSPYQQLLMFKNKIAIIGATHSGQLQSLPLPLKEQPEDLAVHETPLHAGAVTRVCCTHDQGFVFTCSADGSFAIS